MKKLKLFFIIAFLSIFLINTSSKANPILIDFMEDENQKTLEIEGFKVIINFDTSKHRESKEAISILTKKLAEINKIVKPKQLGVLKQVPIWIEWEILKTQGMCYHPSKEWLIGNGYNPKKEKTIEISSVKNFINWQKLNQPYMVLHEFAHAYHHQVLGFNNEKVLKVYKNVVNSKKYESVEYNLGGKKRAYALNNANEYFAELTEAYFGKNDFYPYNKAQLKAFDPLGYQLMEEVWNF